MPGAKESEVYPMLIHHLGHYYFTQAIVVPTLPGNWGCGKNTYSIRLTNKGRLTAYNPYLQFPTIDGYTFTVKSDYPEVIYPNESYDVTVEYEGPEDILESSIGGIRMYYSFKLQGETHQTSETYAALVGCSDNWPILLGGGGLDGDDSGYNSGDDGKFNVDLGGISEDTDETGGTDMPDIQYRDYTQTNHNAITLQFEQHFFLEREAFRGTLVIDNQQMDGIEDIQFVPTVERTDGTDATDLFAISTKVTDLADDASWNLAASETGRATALYVPSKETAPTEPVDYLFGGTVTYRDVATGQLVTQELMKTKLSVNPSPDLHLMYFVQRDFLSDNPLTEEVEPAEPTEFALLIQNKGAGDAINLRIETSEPTVVSNENNLPVDFTALYTTVDGQPVNAQTNIFLLNQIEDEENLPDYVIDQNGNGTDDLEIVSSASATTAGDSDGEYVLTVKASRQGWTYGVLHDPTNGTMQLAKAVRQSDGADLTENFWQTSRSITADYTEIEENRLHWADNLPAADDTYLLTYEPKPGNAPVVRSIELIGEMKTIGGKEQEVVKKARIKFAEPVRMSTVDADDIVLMAAGQQLSVAITMESDTTFVVDWSDNDDITGNYALTVFTSDIKSTEGIVGTTSKTLEWTDEGVVLLGDANGDRLVTIADVTATVNYILDKSSGQFVFRNADVNQDGSITIADVTSIVNIILGKN